MRLIKGFTFTALGNCLPSVRHNHKGSYNTAIACGFVLLAALAHGQNVSTFPTVNQGATPTIRPITIQIKLGGTLNSIQVVTQGGSSLDFTDATGGTCSVGQTYAANATCTVNVQLQPKYPGNHYGAIVATTTAGTAVQFLYGLSQGPVGAIFPGLIRTVAGTTNFLYAGDGIPAINAPIYLPLGEVLDASGNLYLSDSGNHRIRKVDSTGTISTYVGNGVAGNTGDGGAATSASIISPSALVIDGAGNLYFADSGSNVIRVVDAITKNISTVAGVTGAGGYNGDKLASQTYLSQPNGLALDTAQNMYISDTGNNLIRKIDLKLDPSLRVVTTIAGTTTPGFGGDGNPASAAIFNSPWGIAMGIDGYLYIADVNNNVIRKIDPSGTRNTSTVAGIQTNNGTFDGDGGAATAAHLQNPEGVTVDLAGNIYIADTQNNRIRKVNASTNIISTISGGNSQTFAGDGSNSDVATMSGPSSINLDNSGNIYFGDMFHNRVRSISNNIATLSYGQIKNFRTSSPQPETFENDGNGTLTLNQITFNNTALDPATTTCTSTATLATSHSCALGVEFAPTVANLPNGGAITAGSVSMNSDAANSPAVIGVSGDVLTVNPTTVTVSSSQTPSALNVAVTFTATVSNANNGPITGTVDFFDGSTKIGSGTLNAAGVATFTTSSLTLGQHQITAHYSGDSNNAPSASPSITQTVKSGTSLALQSSANPSVFPASVTFTATLSGATTPITGSVIFSDGSTAIGSATPNASGVATISTTTLTPGEHNIVATFSGDVNNLGSAVTLSQSVSQSPTTTTLTLNNSSVTFGTSASFQATVISSSAPNVTGTVTFYDGIVPIGTGTLNASGVATFSISTLSPGAHTIGATYNGDTDNASSISSTATQTILQISTNTVVISDANPSNAGAPINLTATVTATGGTTIGGPLTGSITFYDGVAVLSTQAITAVSAAATFNISTLSVGTHNITAIYSGNTNYAQSTSSTLSQIVKQASTSTLLVSNSNPSIAGKPITLTATVTGNGSIPTGAVNFSDGNTVLGQSQLDPTGKTSFSVSSLSVGTHSLTATYVGNINNGGSVSTPIAQTVNIASTFLTLTSSSNPSKAGIAVTFTATLTGDGGQPTGAVTLHDGSATLGTVAVNGSAPLTFSSSSLSVGTHLITATYSGDMNDATSTSQTISQIVEQVTTSTTLASGQNPGTFGQPITFTANVSSIGLSPTGTVVFSDNGSTIGTASLNGSATATITVSSLALGNHTIVAIYSGDANHLGSQSTAIVQQVLQSTTALITSSVNPSIAKTNVVFTAKIAIVQNVVPTGTVVFKDGGSIIGTGAIDGTGTATLTTSSLAVGTHAIVASYGGDTNYKPTDSAPINQTVLIADTNVTLTSSANPATSGTSITFTATVIGTGGTATGAITFEDGTTIIGQGSLNASGIATLATTTLAPGMHSITALYSGDNNNQPNSSVTLKQQVQQITKINLVSSSNPALTLAPITFTATVVNGGIQPATGALTFMDGSQLIGSAVLDTTGTATLSLPSLSTGTHSITAAYAGDIADFPSNSAVLVENVQLRPTTNILTATATSLTNGKQLTLISVVRWSGPVTPTGTVAFKIGSTTIGTSPVDSAGVATLTIVLDPGAATVVSSYSGDSAYAASDSPPTPISQGPATNFSMQLSLSNITLVSKQHITIDLTLTSIKGFSDELSLGCLGLPFSATCTFSKVQPSLVPDGTQTVQIVIDTGSPLLGGTAGSGQNQASVKTSTVTFCFLPCGVIFGWMLLRSRKRNPVAILLLLALTIVLPIGITGCGTLNLKGTAPGTYSFKVTASGVKTGVTQSTDVTLTVTQ